MEKKIKENQSMGFQDVHPPPLTLVMPQLEARTNFALLSFLFLLHKGMRDYHRMWRKREGVRWWAMTPVLCGDFFFFALKFFNAFFKERFYHIFIRI